MIDDIRSAREAALAQIAAAGDVDAITALAASLLGKRGQLAQLKTKLGALATVDEKRAAGQAVNEALEAVDGAIDARRAELAGAAMAARVESERLDLTEYAGKPRRGHAHVVTQAWERLEDVFIGLGFQIAEGPEVETDWHNFEALNMGLDHPARGEFDTLFVDHVTPDGHAGTTVLRTHTSPVQIRTMLSTAPPIYIVAPGRVFRRDTPDATHMPVFHQIEGLVVDRDITLADLAGTIEAFTKAFFGGDFTSRLRPSYFPFTEPSAEFDIRTPAGDWLELGGCGMVHPNVLAAGGLDPEVWSGFAFGFGIDRMAKERHAVGDLREMFTNDIRFLEQF
ncbi:MAG TPA: phenylalanine--tRNA ligase subunit alpha, partial [Ilumatobacteraceae bacterium]|nr:phenylalanine--tRNA ligase subunit alpha [Ilumatobacteraceae bacterium]